MTEPHHELADLLSSLFARHPDSPPGATGLHRELWTTLQDTGLDRLTGGPSRDGGDAGWAESAVLLRSIGAHAGRVPVAENDLLAGWLLDRAELEAHDTLTRSAAMLDADGRASAVPWASGVDRLVLLWRKGNDWNVADVDVSDVTIEPRGNRAGEPRDSVAVDLTSLVGAAVPAGVAVEFVRRGALSRSHLMVGAMSTITRIVVEHAGVRVQFGRPLAKFQAVQHLVADIAAEAALAEATTAAAADLAGSHGFDDPRMGFAIAASRSVVGHATSVVVRNSHQVLGAIGFTQEHPLHRYTNRLLSWRGEYGSVRYYDDELTRAAADVGAKGLWPLLVTGRSKS